MGISENIRKLSAELPPEVKIVAVSKTRSPSEVMQLYSSGHRIMGENKVQELVAKKEVLPGDIEWHMVGHLQSNKVKYIAPFITLIQSADSPKIIKTINKEAVKNNRVIDCLLQVHIAREESKAGFSDEELFSFLDSFVPGDYRGLRIRGLMGMATFTGDHDVVRSEFRKLSRMFEKIKRVYFNDNGIFTELSMGMSGDYRIAVEEGSTMVRIGTVIFGEREIN
ncbi:MAG: YggS family pyridoxal phosphate-dependent enzyme [Bacteroidales bacterium]